MTSPNIFCQRHLFKKHVLPPSPISRPFLHFPRFWLASRPVTLPSPAAAPPPERSTHIETQTKASPRAFSPAWGCCSCHHWTVRLSFPFTNTSCKTSCFSPLCVCACRVVSVLNLAARVVSSSSSPRGLPLLLWPLYRWSEISIELLMDFRVTFSRVESSFCELSRERSFDRVLWERWGSADSTWFDIWDIFFLSAPTSLNVLCWLVGKQELSCGVKQDTCGFSPWSFQSTLMLTGSTITLWKYEECEVLIDRVGYSACLHRHTPLVGFLGLSNLNSLGD